MNTRILSQIQRNALWEFYTNPPSGCALLPEQVVIEPMRSLYVVDGELKLIAAGKSRITQGGPMWEAQ